MEVVGCLGFRSEGRTEIAVEDVVVVVVLGFGWEEGSLLQFPIENVRTVVRVLIVEVEALSCFLFLVWNWKEGKRGEGDV